MSTVANISMALGYDAAESILASGGSLAAAYALACAATYDAVQDAGPVSHAATVLASDAATIAPRKAA